MPSYKNHSRTLIDVAMGRKPADLVIRGGQWVCVQSGEILPATDIAIVDGRIAFVGSDASHTIGTGTQVIDAGGKFLVPGLLDGHMHVESGMLTVTEFVRAVLPHGTTALFADPHEIANVFGLKGVELMVQEAARQPIHVWMQVPACVPSAPGLETPGSPLGPQEIAEALTWPGIIGLGEMMNYPGVAHGDAKMLAEMDATRQAGKVIGGHYASPDLGLPFHAYAASGAEDDHEGIRVQDAVARARQGMKVMLRYGSAWQDVAVQVKAITELGLDPHQFILCTDDSHAETLINGHMDRVIRHAVQQGLPPMTAIQMATINPAVHFGLSREIGMIAPGRWADILLVENIRDFHACMVIARGKVVAEAGGLLVNLPETQYPAWAMKSIHLKQPLTAKDFQISVSMVSGIPSTIPTGGKKTALVHVIGIIENQAPTRHLKLSVPVNGTEIHADMRQDLAKVALIERHHATGAVRLGLVQGFGFDQACAVASTVAHDCHHLLVVGTDESSMAVAANKLAEVGGGQVVVKAGQVIGIVELPLAGLMSTRPALEVAQKTAAVLAGFRACGCHINNPNMQLSLLTLVVIPELRISDQGLVDVEHFELLPLIQEIAQ